MINLVVNCLDLGVGGWQCPDLWLILICSNHRYVWWLVLWAFGLERERAVLVVVVVVGEGMTLMLEVVHRSAVAESQLAVMGGIEKYVNAKGHAVVKTF
ncbi:hypothetical protein HanRHA438_Chr14g0664961 [Helianthus annuus]|nr:hypothetical protein HanHA300_Chr14g0532601 [Helianthus annuus]KAJ0486508.1 hypothetical protein HanHA89_Chr14g0580411 [Helianthus annuus]KAJ0657074.1 hypothetical protein HanLR1_Chr14g0542991 [Helianthus annuus]KAJ0854656.1 hypothetical protein HanRHA438_Chr14g0664961 [Helianthus annuus]